MLQLADAAVHVKDVEAVVRSRASRSFAQHQLARPARELFSKSLAQVVVELADLDVVQQLVADPVGLDDAWIEGIGDAVGARDQLQVRQRAR